MKGAREKKKAYSHNVSWNADIHDIKQLTQRKQTKRHTILALFSLYKVKLGRKNTRPTYKMKDSWLGSAILEKDVDTTY